MDICTQHVGIYCENLEESLDFYLGTLGFYRLFSADAEEDGKALKMAWIKHSSGIVIELLQLEGYLAKANASADLNHLALRVQDIDTVIAELISKGLNLEVKPFNAQLLFDKPLNKKDKDVFSTSSDSGVNLKVAFFRGPSGERFELMQDNLGESL